MHHRLLCVAPFVLELVVPSEPACNLDKQFLGSKCILGMTFLAFELLLLQTFSHKRLFRVSHKTRDKYNALGIGSGGLLVMVELPAGLELPPVGAGGVFYEPRVFGEFCVLFLFCHLHGEHHHVLQQRGRRRRVLRLWLLSSELLWKLGRLWS